MGALEQHSLKTTSFPGHFNPLWMYSEKKYTYYSLWSRIIDVIQLQAFNQRCPNQEHKQGSLLRATLSTGISFCCELPSAGACYSLSSYILRWKSFGKLLISFKLLK